MFRQSAYILIVAMLSLVALGLVMLLSVSAFAPDNCGNTVFFLTRQSIWLGIGLIVGVVMWRADYHWLCKISPLLLLACCGLLIACFLPGIGAAVKGSHRWLHLGIFSVQPSEFTKLAVVCFLASWLGKHQHQVEQFKQGFAIPFAVVLGMTIPLLLQPDLGSSALLVSVMCLLMFIAGCRLRYIVPLLSTGVVGILGIALLMPERKGRLLAFIHPELYRANKGYQVWQALIAFGSGGVEGLGLGNSVQKMFYLPEAHTDFIFPIIGEELGLFWTLVVVSCFVVLALTGGYISTYAPDVTGALLGWGVTALICLQAVANMCVVTGCLPAKGLGLPFISYGGSNLVICLACVGILLNIHRQALYEPESNNVLLAEA